MRVRAASVNPPDWAGVHGVPYIVRAAFGLRRPKLGVRGTDLAGTVEAIGANVTRLSVGDEVFGVGVGTFAEYAVAKEEHLVPKPAGITFEQAAATGMAALTALQALRDAGRIQAGQKVLIVGAGGGIGTFAVQIAKSFGAHVTGVCSTSKQELVRSLGADDVIDYTREDFTQGGERYDLILDNVLRHSLSELLRALDRRGTLVPNGGQFYKRWFASTGVLLVKAPLLSLFVPQQIRVCSRAPRAGRSARPEGTHRVREADAGRRPDVPSGPGRRSHLLLRRGARRGQGGHHSLRLRGSAADDLLRSLASRSCALTLPAATAMTLACTAPISLPLIPSPLATPR